MKKILAIGDIHGLNTWKDIVAKENDFDVCIFVGDYFDSFHLDAQTQLDNFKDIWHFAIDNTNSKKEVILLLGNHDLHYLLPGEQYSGYQPLKAMDIREALGEAGDQLQYAAEIDGFLFTHAGVTKTWAEKWKIYMDSPAESINKLGIEAFTFSMEQPFDPYGDTKHQGPLWVRPNSLLEDQIDIYFQVVGHTEHKNITMKGKSIALIDSLPSGNYITIENGKIKPKSL